VLIVPFTILNPIRLSWDGYALRDEQGSVYTIEDGELKEHKPDYLERWHGLLKFDNIDVTFEQALEELETRGIRPARPEDLADFFGFEDVVINKLTEIKERLDHHQTAPSPGPIQTNAGPTAKLSSASYLPADASVAAYWEQVTDMQLAEFRALLKSRGMSAVQAWFLPKDAAMIVNRNDQVVRKWCREGRIDARKREGTGPAGREPWEIHVSALMYFMNHGKLPARLRAE
jgi:hypothetical protein